MYVNETQGQQYIASAILYICYNCTQLTGMLSTVARHHQACQFKFHPTSVHTCSTCTRPAGSSPVLIVTGSADMFDYVAQDQHTCLKPSSLFLEQLLETNRPDVVPMFLNFALNQQACLVQLCNTRLPDTSVTDKLDHCPVCMSIKVASHQQICLNQ